MAKLFNKKQSWWVFALSLTFILTACGQANSIATIKEVEAAGLTITATSTTTAMPQATSTTTPTETPSLTITPSPTATLASFTKTPLPSPTAVLANLVACDSSAYVDDVTIPDGKKVTSGDVFKKTWRLKNTGTCAWTKDYSIVFVSGSSMDGETTKINKYVTPGKDANITVLLTAPDVEGTYTGYWQLTDRNGIRFGQVVYVQIVVSNDN